MMLRSVRELLLGWFDFVKVWSRLFVHIKSFSSVGLGTDRTDSFAEVEVDDDDSTADGEPLVASGRKSAGVSTVLGGEEGSETVGTHDDDDDHSSTSVWRSFSFRKLWA